MTYSLWIIITGVLVGVTCGMTGALLVLRKMSMLADAISHTVLLGIVGAFLVTHSLNGVPMLVGAATVGILTALMVQLLDSSGVQSDAAIGVVFTSLFALGVVLISFIGDSVHLDVEHALMGEIAFVPWDTWTWNGMNLGPTAVWLLGFVFILNLTIILLFYKEFKISTFDPQLAISIGVPVVAIHYVLMSMVSFSTVASFDSVGAILVVAMLIVPGATSYLLTDSFGGMIALSALIGALSSLLGYTFALFVDVSISGAMATATGLLFTLAFFLSPKHGMLAKWYRRKQMQKQQQLNA
ncbi:metal ABC transporter permease [Pontibacillus sp. ALD_SL1]|uniref:metal ABC transporter permease n=1 Tax=Pontibacillus sp. ALD_SL1 TaxID=2777185 RepID=UPI001A95DBC8|nr:metal ABC transporter permease [Pontibacillus sp. ALD_SL1]QST00561.1 metal ABC transporter permease [Pontibacillus sp. ALD_SL1]